MGDGTNNVKLKIASELLKLKKCMPNEILEIYSLSLAKKDNILVFGIKAAGTNLITKSPQSIGAFAEWNLGNRAPNGVFRETRITRLLLELVSISKAMPDKIRFALYYNGSFYWLDELAKFRIVKTTGINNIARMVTANG